MSIKPKAFPLTWPATMPRAKSREKGQFRTELPAALKNVENSLKLFGSDSGKAVGSIILSSNVTLGQAKPADPGVAAWFLWDGMQVCIPVDRYDSVAGNLQAIHHIIEARRVELRHGTLALVRASFQGFTALPSHKKPWQILGTVADAPEDVIQAAWRAKMAVVHPDKGGTEAAAAEVNAARDAMLQALQ